MNYNKKYSIGKGWFNESYRHSLARKGIKTSKRVNYVKNQSKNDIQRLITQAQQEALTERKERIGFAKKEYLKSEFYKGHKVTFTKLGDDYIANLGGEFGYVGVGKTKDESFTLIKNMVKDHGLPSGTVTLDFSKKQKSYIYWVEDKDDQSVEFEGSVSKSLDKTKKEKEKLEKLMPDKKFIIKKEKIKGHKKVNYTLKLEDPRKYKFGSVKWQDTMLYNILEKRKHNEELSPVEKSFLEVQEEHISRINYQQVSYQPTQITTPVAPPPDLEEIPEEHRRLERGWIQRGIKKEAEVGRKIVSGVGKVGRGILGTIVTGLAWEPEEETNFAKKVKKIKVITKEEKRFNKKLDEITKDLVKLTKKIKIRGEKK